MPITTPSVDGVNATRDAGSAWLSPQLIFALSPQSYKDWTIPAGVPTLVLTPNPMRIGCAFLLSVATVDGTFVSPYSDPQSFGVPIPATQRIASFSADDLFSLVGSAWYIYHASGATVRVIQFVKPS